MEYWAKVRFRQKEGITDEYSIRASVNVSNSEERSVIIKNSGTEVEFCFGSNPKKEEAEEYSSPNLDNPNFATPTIEEEEEESTPNLDNPNFATPTIEEAKEESTPNLDNPNIITPVITEKGVSSELDELAKKASSYEDFVKSIAKWLDLDKREEFFIKSVMLAEKFNAHTWEQLKEVLDSNNVHYIEYDKTYSSKKITSKFPDRKKMSLMKLIKEIISYKQIFSSTGAPEAKKKRIKLACMPEIPSFEEALGGVDKTQPIEKRVKYVLNAMGLEEKSPEEQALIFRVANTAVRLEKVSTENMYKIGTNYSEGNANFDRMTFGNFIRSFVEKYEPNYQRIKTVDFITDLKAVIMLDSEL